MNWRPWCRGRYKLNLEIDIGVIAGATPTLRACAAFRIAATTAKEDAMPTFMLSLNWTDQGIRNIKDAPKRAQAARELAKKLNIEIKNLYLTTGDSDLVAFLDTASGDNIAKFAMAIGSLGNVRTRTARAWPEAEYLKMISELP
jgi:uncharacterized protein with GYD domain